MPVRQGAGWRLSVGAEWATEGRKRSHWMWYIFPQLKQLGYSYNSKYYGISGRDEATAYLEDPILGPRLREVSEANLALPTDDAREVFGGIDSMKLRSSMTLFDAVAPADIFARVIDKYFRGRRDQRTLTLIAAATEWIEAFPPDSQVTLNKPVNLWGKVIKALTDMDTWLPLQNSITRGRRRAWVLWGKWQRWFD